jgi:WD40 repeat protein
MNAHTVKLGVLLALVVSLFSCRWAGADPLPAGVIARLGQPPIQHNSEITSLAFSQDGKTLLSGSMDLTFSFWDLATGQELRRIDFHKYGTTYTSAVSPDGKQLVILPGVGGAALIDLATGKIVRKFHQDAGVVQAAFSADGKLLASGGWPMMVKVNDYGKSIRVQNVDSGAEICAIDDYFTDSVAFSPDGTMLLSGGSEGTSLWQVATGKRLRHWKQPVSAVAFAPHGKLVASRHEDTIQVWDIASGALTRFKGEEAYRGGILFLPDGKTLAAASSAQVVRLWDQQTAKEKQTFRPGSLARRLAISPDGKMLAAGCENGRIFLWNTNSGGELLAVKPQKQIVAAAFAGDGKPLAIGVHGNDLVLWDVLDAKEKRRLPLWDVAGIWPRLVEGECGACNAVALSPDGNRLAVDYQVVPWDSKTAAKKATRTFRLWDVQTGKELHRLAKDMEVSAWWGGFGGRNTHSVAFSPNGKTLAWSSFDGKLLLLDPATGKEIARLPEGPDEKTMVFGSPTWTPDSKRVVVTGVIPTEGSFFAKSSPAPRSGLRLWDINRGKVARPFSWDATALAVSADGELLAGSSTVVWIADLATGKHRDTSPWDSSLSVEVIAFAPDSRWLASAAGGEIRLWDTVIGETRTLIGHKGAVRTLAFAVDGKSLLSGSQDGTAILWELKAK